MGAPSIFVVSSSFPARFRRGGRPDVGMQRHWLFVQTHYGFLRIVRPLIGFQNTLHLGNVFVIEVGDAPHFFLATA